MSIGSLRLSMLALCLPPLSSCDALSGLMGKKASAEETCSSQVTYDALTAILADQAGSAASMLGTNNALSAASSPGALKNVLSYASPTVEDVNKATGKITCNALVRISVTTANLGDQGGLHPNDFGPDHVTYAISYSVQRTADEGKPLTTLQDASALSTVAFQASLVALKRGQDAASAAQATVATPPDDGAQDEPTEEEAQERSDSVNAQAAALNEPDAPASEPANGNQP